MRELVVALGISSAWILGCGSAAPPELPHVAVNAVGPAPRATSAPPPVAKSAHGPSCDGRLGADEKSCNGESCCTRLGVPATIAKVRRAGKVEDHAVKAFTLDKYEATVGRFRAWLAAGQPVPKAGDVIYDDGKGHKLTWSETASVQLGDKLLEGWKRYDTWTGGDDRRPKNFVSWYTAAAFCRWDGGRLPTDDEWFAAALGGDEDRAYPWGDASPTPELAVFNCMGDGNGQCAIQDILPVGSRPKGAGRWGHVDLAGSMFEWTLDALAAPVVKKVERARGGGFCYIGGMDRRANTGLKPTVFREEPPNSVSHMTGVRCAYDAGVPAHERPATNDPVAL